MEFYNIKDREEKFSTHKHRHIHANTHTQSNSEVKDHSGTKLELQKLKVRRQLLYAITSGSYVEV